MEDKNKRKSKKTSERDYEKINIKENEVINRSVTFNLLEVVIIILITGIGVSIASEIIIYNKYNNMDKQTSEVTKDELKEFEEIYSNIVNNYVEEVNKEELIESAINGMYNYLNDEYSVYMNKEDTESLQEQLQGEYTGVGIEIATYYEDENKTSSITMITKVFSDSPAEKAGLLAGDIIKKIDGVEIIDADTISNTIKNGDKESYEITYERDSKEYTVTLKREHVVIDSVTSNVYDNVGYIKLDTFSSTTKDQIVKKLDSFDKKVTSIVIDLRDNTGGYLNAAFDISDLFIEKGKVVYQLKDRNGLIEKHFAKTDVYKKYNNIVVLINENSASASEVLALALKESAGAKIVGVTSYGKGTVQDTEKLSSGAMVKYTTSYWLSPNGNSINKTGIEPDIIETNVDNQLNKAIETAK